ncbi:MAG: hypothetical protein RJA36_2398 [Pseudomonadota bacterium]
MEQTDGDSDGGASLHGLRRALARAPWLLPPACVVLGLLALAALYGAEAFGLLRTDTASALPLLAGGATLLATLPLGLLLLAGRRAIQGILLQLECSQQQADVLLRRRARLAKLTARLQLAQSPAELARLLLSELARATPMQQALCCFWDEQGRALTPAAHYGGEGTSKVGPLTDQARLGGLLLEAAQQRRVLSLAHPGAGFLRIASGLGDTEPAELLIYPVQDRGQLFAVLELAGLQPFGEEDRNLLAEVAPVFSMHLDILQRAERSAALLAQARAAEENLRQILGAVSEGIWGMDREGRVTFVNPAALAMLGYRLDEVLGQSMHGLVHHHRADGRELALCDCAMYRTAQDGQERRVEGEVLWHKDGSAIAVDYVVTPVRQDGTIAGVVVVCRAPLDAATARSMQPAAGGVTA